MTTTEPTVKAATTPALSPAHKKDLDQAIDELSAGVSTWASLDLNARVALFQDVHRTVGESAQAWVDAAVASKKLPTDSPLVGEEWSSGPFAVLSSLTTLIGSLKALAAGQSPIAKLKIGTAPGDRVSVRVLPSNAQESTLFNGFSVEVWTQPGVSRDRVIADAGLGARTPTKTDGVGLVLGAGNITSIPPLDVLYELIANNRVALLKLNPVMDRMLEPYQTAFAPLIETGLVRIVSGEGHVGAYLTQHHGISHVHITGSAATHDLIVWGSGPEAAKRKAAGTPLLTKPITSELGGVAPVIVLPGTWSKADLKYQAEHVATMRLHNGGYNCIAGQLVVLSSDWPQKDAFLEQLRIALASAPARPAWYPGSDGRVQQACDVYPDAEKFEAGSTRLLVELDPDKEPTDLLTTEYFSPVLGVIEQPGTGQAFFDEVVDMVNEEFAGTLGANVIASPSTMKSLGAGFMNTIAKLRYGTVAINSWTGFSFTISGARWGAFPGHTLDNVSSGLGVVHNAFLIDHTERSVARGPFRPFPRSFADGEFTLFPKPPWFVSARSAAATGEQLTKYAKKPSWLKMPAVFGAAFRA